MKHIIDISNGKQSFETFGEGYPILLLAGGPGMHAAYLQDIVEQLSVNFNVILFHQRGTDPELNDVPMSHAIGLSTYIEDIDEVRTFLSISEWHVLGHSWGAMLASAYASKYNTFVQKLILVNSAGLNYSIFERLTDNVIQRLSGKEYAKALELGAQLMTPEGAQVAVEFLTTVMPAYFYNKALSHQFSKKLDESFLNFNVFAAVMQDVVSTQWHLGRDDNQFSGPVLYVTSRQDIIDYEVVYDIMQSYNNLEQYTIEKAGHYCWMEQKQMFFNRLNQFLNI